MAKKTLNEATIRRFQKLANVAPINEMYGTTSEYYMKEEEEEAAEAPADDMDKMDDMDDMPKDDMGDLGSDDGEKSIDVEQGDLQAVVDAIPALQNIADALEGVLDADDGDDMGDMDDMGDDEETALASKEDDAADALMEALEGISYEPSQAEIVNEVALRVARRLQEAKLHEAKLNKALGRK